jgi:DNA-directed RNA polymerase subunit M
MIQFCPKCGSIIKPKKERDKVILECSCGYKSSGSSADSASFKEEKKVNKDEAEFAVVDKEIETLPITKEECPNCGNNEAYFWTHQTRGADEPETKFLRCTKCKHTWRDYG